MTISQTQIVDILYKKLQGVSKTDISTAKSPANEGNASPYLAPGSTIWQQDYLIPTVTTLPTSNSSVVTVYRQSLSSAVQTISLSESTVNQTWTTGLTNWISPQFGAGYQLKLYAGPPGNSTLENFTQLPVGGSGNNDSWYFDYIAGIVNFADTNIPNAAANVANVVYVEGARYTGVTGINTFANLQIANIAINGNTITGNANGITFGSNIFVSNIFYANGVPFVSSTYGNTQVAQYLSSNTVANIAVTGNISSTGILTNNFFYANGQPIVFNNNTYGNANVAAYLASNTITGNINTQGSINTTANVSASYLLGNIIGTTAQFTTLAAGNINANVYGNNISANIFYGNMYYGNIVTDTITPYQTSTTVFNSTSAVGLPSGTTAQRPTNSAMGYTRYNTDTGTIEYWDGAGWISIINQIADQTISPDGVSSAYSLIQPATTIGVLVSINGTVQRPGSAYSVSGQTITFVEVPLITDIIDIRFLASSVTYNFPSNQSTFLNTVIATTATTLIDTFPIAGNATVNWTVSANDTVNNHYKSSTISSLNNGTTVYYTESAILKTSASNVATFTSNITAGNINLWAVGDSANVSVTFERLVLGSATPSGYLTAGIYLNSAAALVNGAATFSLTPDGNVTLSPGGMVNYANGVSILTGITGGGGTTYSNANVASYLVASAQTIGNLTVTGTTTIGSTLQLVGGTNTITTTNGSSVQFGSGVNFNSSTRIAVSGNIIAQSGTPSTSTSTGAIQVSGGVGVSGSVYTGGNVTAPYFVGNAVGTTATYTGNVQAAYFVGNGAALTGITANGYGNIYGTTSNVTLVAGTYNYVFDTTGNLTMPANGDVVIGTGGSIISTSGNLSIIGNLTTTGSGYFTGAFNENDTRSGVFVGNTGSGTPSPRVAFFNGNTTQNWQIDNYFGAFRWFTPGVTRMNLDGNTNQLTVYGNVSTTGQLISKMGTANTDSQLVLQGNVYKGGAGYHDFLRVTSTYTSATNPNKYFRLNSTGNLEIINSGYNSTIFSLTDVGDTTIAGNLTVNGINSGYAPNRPAFRVVGLNSTGYTTSSPTGGILTGSQFGVDYNQGSYLNTSTGVFTAPVAGLYQVCFNARANSNSGPAASIAVQKNSGTNIAYVEWAANTTANHIGASTIVKLAVGDTLKLVVTAGTVNFDGNDNWSAAYLG